MSFDGGFDIAAFGDAVGLALVSVDDVLEVALDEVFGLVDEGLVDGDVLGVDDDELDDDGDVLGLIDELEDVEPLGVVDGVVVVVDDEDFDGDGVTTGGVVVDVFVSR